MITPEKCGVEIADLMFEGGPDGVLLIHRLGGTPAEFSFIAEGLANTGQTVSCPLLYGHGGSRALLGATTWEHWYGTVEKAHDHLSQHCRSILVGGLGVGALLALKLAAEKRSAVDGVALFSPTIWPNGWAMPWYSNALRMLGSKQLANLIRFDERPPYGIKDENLRRSMFEAQTQDSRPSDDILGRVGGALLEVKWLARDVLPKLAAVTQPCLIFHPRHDDRSRLSVSQMLQKRLGGIVDLIVLEDSYHLVTLDRQRELVLDRLQTFASGLPSPARTVAGSTPA